MTKTLLKNFEGIDIFIDDETGQFSAKVGRKDVKKRNLRDVEKEIEAVSGAVIAYEIDSNYPRIPRRAEITQFSNDRAREKDGHLMGHYDYLYLLEPDQLAKLEEIAERYSKVKNEFSEYVHTLPRLKQSNFAEVKRAQNKP